jgi:hypothetical protein
MGLDVAAYDYSYDREGKLVVWEANPFPYIQFSGIKRRQTWSVTTRALAAMALCYFDKAGVEAPTELTSLYLQP